MADRSSPPTLGTVTNTQEILDLVAAWNRSAQVRLNAIYIGDEEIDRRWAPPNTIQRLAGNMPSASFWWGLLAIPVVMAFTALARLYPPPLTPTGLRRVAFCLLFLSGLSLAAPAFLKLFGDLS